MIRAVFFDFDGVLVDSEPLHCECWAEVLAGYGIPMDAEGYTRQFIGVSNRDMIEILCRQHGRAFDAAFFDECYGKKKIIYEQRVVVRCRTPADLLDFIRTRSKALRFGVVSSSARSEVEPHRVGQGIREAITALVCQEDVEKLKPAPDPYLRALELVNAALDGNGPIGAGECLVVEDSGPGAEAGFQAGMRVLRVSGPGEVLKLLRAFVG
jgi:beta-phosphoglucomutase